MLDSHPPIGILGFGDNEKQREAARQAILEFYKERQKQFDAEPPHGLRPSPQVGWKCPNCGRAHGPDVSTCPDPPRGKGLRDRIGECHNG